MAESDTASWQDEILARLDAAQDDYFLLAPGNAHYPSAAMRLTAFASDSRWLLTVQLLAWGRREAAFVRHVQVFDSTSDEAELLSTEPIQPVDDEKLFVEGELQLDLRDFSVLINGERRHFTFSDEDYSAAGIDLEETPAPLALLRLLADREPDALLLDADAILETVGASDVTPLFSLDDWHHPDPGEDELPSELPCFRSIAESIARRTTETPAACEDGNTHWSNWTEFE